MKYPNLDYSGDLTPSEAHLASVWPLEKGERHTMHMDLCAVHDGDDCDCVPVAVFGPTRFA